MKNEESFSVNHRCLLVADACAVEELGYGFAEVEVEVNPDWKMIGIVSDIEAEKVLFLLLLVVEEGEDKTAVGLVVVGLEILPASVDEDLVAQALACDHTESGSLSDLVSGEVHGAGEGKNIEHVVDTFGACHLLIRPFSVGILVAHLHGSLVVAWIGIPHLIDCIAFAFAGSLAEIERHEFMGGIADEGVAHWEELVTGLVAQEDEVGPECLLAFIARRGDIELGGSDLHPYELPVEVEVEGK